ncbi:NUDIX hydrolase [Actinomadura miaoliensis]|uniref:Nudix hydrolase domain-containing protein n=1 Tax=Actinomadura miaoliensis TaxID=430685 RepID=A0ABP7W7S1_9ACTN
MIVTLPGRINHYRRGKAWMKWLTGIDASRPNELAFQGQFVNAGFGSKIEAALGDWLLHYDEDVSPSGHCHGIDIALYRVTDKGLIAGPSWRLPGLATGTWTLHVRDEISRTVTAASLSLHDNAPARELAAAAAGLRRTADAHPLLIELALHLTALAMWGPGPRQIEERPTASWSCRACGDLGQMPERCPGQSALQLARTVTGHAPSAAEFPASPAVAGSSPAGTEPAPAPSQDVWLGPLTGRVFGVLVAALTVHQGSILLLRRSLDETFMPGAWSIPAGKIQPPESLEQAALRELEEEAGIGGRVLHNLGPIWFDSVYHGQPLQNIQFNLLIAADRAQVHLDGSNIDHLWLPIARLGDPPVAIDEFTMRLLHSAADYYWTHNIPSGGLEQATR